MHSNACPCQFDPQCPSNGYVKCDVFFLKFSSFHYKFEKEQIDEKFLGFNGTMKSSQFGE